MPKSTTQLQQWKGSFGKRYTNRNPHSLQEMEKIYRKNYGITRLEMNKLFLGKIDRSARILEVGCNVGNQLVCLQKMGFLNLYGIEPQDYAFEKSKQIIRNINIIRGDAFDIPFKDSYFDIVFTAGVLIHIHPKDLKEAMKEIHRCSRKYIWGFEYYSDSTQNILYRGHKNLLWKGNFVKKFTELFPLDVVNIKYYKYLTNDNIDVMYLLKKNR